jgi:hypothetical protein
LDPALLALMASTNAQLASLMSAHIMGENNAEVTATKLADVTKALMDGLNILDGEG